MLSAHFNRMDNYDVHSAANPVTRIISTSHYLCLYEGAAGEGQGREFHQQPVYSCPWACAERAHGLRSPDKQQLWAEHWKLSLVQRIGKAVKVNATLDNLFGYKPKYYYLNSPITDGVTFQIGVSIDIDKFF